MSKKIARTQPFNACLSRTTREETFTHSHQWGKEGFAQVCCMGAYPLYGALSQRGLLDAIKLAYNESWRNIWLKLTASTFNRLWISMPAVLVMVPIVTQNSLHPSSTSSIIARHLLDSMVQGKTTEADAPTNHLNATPCGLLVPPPPLPSHFLHRVPFLLQPSHFILPWDRHQIMLACVPGIERIGGQLSLDKACLILLILAKFQTTIGCHDVRTYKDLWTFMNEKLINPYSKVVLLWFWNYCWQSVMVGFLGGG